jgi:hypothetical protein
MVWQEAVTRTKNQVWSTFVSESIRHASNITLRAALGNHLSSGGL